MKKDHAATDWPHEWIKKIRSRPSSNASSKRMRQIDLAQRVGVDPRTVQQWENGDRLPSVGSLKRIIQTFQEDGLFATDNPRAEAEALWGSVQRFSEARSATGREFPDFDAGWFESLHRTNVEAPAVPLFPASPSLASAGRIPKQSFRWIGRERLIPELDEAFELYSLVSIVGSGGIGKTSSAVRFASERQANYAGGVWVFEFSRMTEALELLPQILSVMQLQQPSGRSETQILAAAIADRRTLFVFDNCEHVIDEAAALAETLLEAAPGLSILVTSREPLNISGEYVYRLPALSYPPDEYALRELAASEIQLFESVRLFLDRAHTIAPLFRPDEDQVRRIGDICRKLNGIPLAIELAAARLRLLNLEQIESRLSNLLTFLTGGKRTAEARQQTLKSTIDWSYNLLDTPEQRLLRELGVFSGSFTLEAAEQIGGSADPKMAPDLLDSLSALVDQSLVGIEMSENGLSARYVLLESVREYAREKSESESTERDLQKRYASHARYYDQRLRRAEAAFRTREREEALLETRQDYANLRSALQRTAQDEEMRDIGLHLAANLYWFWLHEDRLSEGLFWLDCFLNTDDSEGLPNADRAKARHGKGVMLFVQGHLEEALDCAKSSIRDSRALNERSLLASSLRLAGFIRIRQGMLEEAEADIRESLLYAQKRNDFWNLASSLHALGRLRLVQNRNREAVQVLKESIRLFGIAEDRWEVSGPYESLGQAALKLKRFDEAVESFKKSIAVCEIYKGLWVLSRGIEGLAIALCAKGQYAEAAVLFGAAEKCRKHLGDADSVYFSQEYPEALNVLRERLDESRFSSLWLQGGNLTPMQAVTFALEC